MSMPDVSIVVINHNYDRFLHEAIESALNQTHPAAEIIVFDDGSTDNSKDIIEKYADYVQVIMHDHVGLVQAFNVAASLAHGEIIFLLDADDRLYPHCIKEVLDVWRDDLSKVQFQLDTIDGEGVDQGMPFPHFPRDLDEAAIFEQALKYGTYPWTVRSGNAYSASFLRQVLPIDQEKIFKAPDGYVNKLAPLFGGVISLRQTLGCYRVHGQNIWAQAGSTFRIQPIVDNVKLDVAMYEIFKHYAARHGYKIAPFDDICLPNQVEIRLLAQRFDESGGASLARLKVIGRRAIKRAPNLSFFGKFIWRLWFSMLEKAPLKIIEYIYLRTRSQSGRPALVRNMAGLLRGSARTSAS